MPERCPKSHPICGPVQRASWDSSVPTRELGRGCQECVAFGYSILFVHQKLTPIVIVDVSGPTVPEEVVGGEDIPRHSGYSQSKWIAECMLMDAAKRTKLRPVVVRVGQLTGSDNGAWNEKDWFPALVKSSRHLGCLPELQGVRR